LIGIGTFDWNRKHLIAILEGLMFPIPIKFSSDPTHLKKTLSILENEWVVQKEKGVSLLKSNNVFQKSVFRV
jgi:hypothetical protein